MKRLRKKVELDSMDKVIISQYKENDTMDIWFGNQGDGCTCEKEGGLR